MSCPSTLLLEAWDVPGMSLWSLPLPLLMAGVQDAAWLFPAWFVVRTTQLLGSESPLFSGCSQRHSQDQCLGEVVGRKPPGATVSTALSSSLELIPRSFRPKGTGGTTVKIVLKEKHKKGKGWRGQALCL